MTATENEMSLEDLRKRKFNKQLEILDLENQIAKAEKAERVTHVKAEEAERDSYFEDNDGMVLSEKTRNWIYRRAQNAFEAFDGVDIEDEVDVMVDAFLDEIEYQNNKAND